MNLPQEPIFTSDPSEILLRHLSVRPVGRHEREAAQRCFDQEHYLGAIRPVGRTLIQVVEYKERWVALLDWGPAVLKLADREAWIGWTDQQRAQRLGLVVQNRRFLVLSKTRMPNLASRSLALAVKALPEHWQAAHGYRPVLAESFTDIEQFAGTCYKAAGWEPCGLTKGFARHRADYYHHHGRPKKLWLKPLNRNCRRILQAVDLPAAYRKGANEQSPERALPLKKPQIDSLRQWLRDNVEDPRAPNRKFTCSSLLTLVAMALLAGRKHLTEIQRFGQFLTHTQRVWLQWPRKKNSRLRCAPSYSALYNLLGKIDPHAFAAALSQWLQTHQGTLPRALAIDGKYVRDQVLTVCLSEHESGAPVAIGIAEEKPRSEDNKRDGELTVARRLYEHTNLQNALVSGDALHCNQHDARKIVEKGGDYLLQLKNENRKALQHARTLAEGSPLLPTQR
jgi:hypothetical protein